MNIEKRMETVKESWNRNGEFIPTLKPFYEELETAEENISDYQKTVLLGTLEQFLFSSIDSWIQSMPENVKKGIMKGDFDENNGDGDIKPFVEQFLNDTYNSDGELNFDGRN